MKSVSVERERSRMGFTIKDVAKLAGVSHATVSRVINCPEKVKPKTYNKVMQIIEDSRFSPQLSARALNSGKTYMIGLLITYDVFQATFPIDFIPGILQGLLSVLNSSNYSLSLFWDQTDNTKRQAILDSKMNQNLDGLLVLGLETTEHLAYRLSKLSIPIVLVNHRFNDLPICSVTIDDKTGAVTATNHLISLGHKNIVFVEGDPKFTTTDLRKQGYLHAMDDAGLPVDPRLVIRGFYKENDAYISMKKLLDQKIQFSAVFSSNDIMALGILRALTEYGLRVPKDVALIGYDDTEFSALINPSLSTIRKPRVRLGCEAATMMLNILKRAKPADADENVVIQTELVIRESTSAKVDNLMQV